MNADSRIIDPETLLSSREACALLSCSKVSLWRWMRDDAFPKPLRFSPTNQRSRLRFVRSEILAWIEAQQRLTTEAKSSSERPGIHGAAAAGACAAE